MRKYAFDTLLILDDGAFIILIQLHKLVLYGAWVCVCVGRAKYSHWPSGAFSVSSSQLRGALLVEWPCLGARHVHFRLGHLVNELVLTLGDLDDLFNQASANLILHVGYSICPLACDFVDGFCMATYWSAVSGGSGSSLSSLMSLAGS